LLLTRIRRVVKGFEINATMLVALAFANDLTIFVKDNNELQNAIRIIENFEEATGLAINRQKSEILELGVKAAVSGIPVSEMVKITGVHFSLDKNKMVNRNWSNVLEKVT
jgi:ribosome-interacting GTPase 1